MGLFEQLSAERCVIALAREVEQAAAGADRFEAEFIIERFANGRVARDVLRRRGAVIGVEDADAGALARIGQPDRGC